MPTSKLAIGKRPLALINYARPAKLLERIEKLHVAKKVDAFFRAASRISFFSHLTKVVGKREMTFGPLF